MTDLSERISALSPAKRELLLQKLRERAVGTLVPAAPVPADEPATASDEPRFAVEEVLASLWTTLLGLEHVGIHDDFFALGGHSLLATQLAARIPQAFGIEMPIVEIFQSPTIAKMATYIESSSAAQNIPPIERASRQEPIPLSYSQERVWFLHQLNPRSTAYHVPRCLEIHGDLRIDALENAFTEIARRHEIVRTTFPAVGGQPVQVVHPPSPFHVRQVDFSQIVDEDEHRPAVNRYWRSEGQRPFDLAKGGLLRVDLLRFAKQKYYLLLIEHHLVHDGWTQGVLLRELIALYNAFSQGRPSPLSELPIQFADYAIWQRRWLEGPAGETQLRFWKERLAGLPTVFGLPLDKPRPATQTSSGDQEIVMIPAVLAQQLRSLARAEGVTLFMVLLAAFKLLLGRYARTSDVWVGSGIANRRRKEMESLMGMVVNNIVLRTDLSNDPSFHQLVSRVRETCLAAYEHQDVPFEKVVQAVKPARSLSHSPLFQVMFSFHDSPAPLLRMDGVKVRGRDLKVTSAKFDLNIVALPYREQKSRADASQAGRFIWTSWEYSTDIFERSTIQRMTRQYLTLLGGIVADPGRRISEYSLLGGDEYQQVLALSQAKGSYQPHECLHTAFARHVEKIPDAIAIVFEDQRMTYADLDQRSNRLAHLLQSAGVGPDAIVGLAVERSLDMPVGMLGILKAGGAYLPLDPSYPPERLDYMLTDAGISIIVTHSATVGRLPATGARLVVMDQDEDISRCATIMPRSQAQPGNLAYLMYTSGSTGRPKGVMVTHESVVRLFRASEAFLEFGPSDVWSQFHSSAFDFSVWELWGALLHGGRAVIVPYWTSRSADAFRELLGREGVTMLSQTPSAFVQLIQADARAADALKLRAVIFGGEALNYAELRPWLRRYGDAHPRLINMYGITETTVHVTHREIDQAAVTSRARSAIGRGLGDLNVYVLDDRLELVPVGVPGELCVGGPGLSRGYFNRPGLTAERFVPNPFGTGDRLYRSGDLVCWGDGNELEYLGRMDRQVKIRGYRIELGEIEATLMMYPGVRQAVVLERRQPPNDRQIVAYVVPDQLIGQTVEPSELHAHLKKSLPDYMMPSVILLDALPLTSNGKIDSDALPVPERAALCEYVAPRTPTEKTLAEIWCGLLQAERVGVNDNFFDLGGHSLMAMRMMARVRDAFGVQLSVRDLFDAATVAEMASLIEHEEWDEIGIAVAERE